MLLEAACRKRGIRKETEIHLYAAEPGPMGVAGPEVSKAVRQMVESKGISYHPEHQIVVSIPLKMGKPLPKAGVFAHGEASVVVRNIAREIRGKGKPAQFDGEGECFIETGDGKAGFGRGNFYAEPSPQVNIHPPARRWHAAKILFEKDWLRRWF